MGEMKPTNGAAYNKREGYSTVYVFVPIGRGLVQEVAACGPTETGQEEQQANADLITEAFNAFHNTGLSPVQLVEQRDELMAACRKMVEWEKCEKDYSIGFTERVNLCAEAFEMMRAALAKCEGVGNE